MTPEQLKASILQYAIQGKLVEQRPEEKKVDLSHIKLKKTEEFEFDIPDSWLTAHLESITKNVPSKQYQIAASDFKTTGKYPVVSQSKEYIIGYNDDASKLYRHENPVVIFGDHTTEVKYVDFDFIVGADGVKIFEPIETVIVGKFLKHILEFYSIGLEKVGGYSRHYKFIKDKAFPIPPLSEQKRIVAKIEELLPYVDRYAAAYEKLEQFNAKFPEDMKKSILQYAIQGKLVEQRPEEGTGEELYRQMHEEIKILEKEKVFKTKDSSAITEDEKPFDIPDSWKWVRLGEILNIESGKGLTAKQMRQGDIPVFGGNGITGYHDEALIEKETVVIGRVGFYCGSVHVTPPRAWVTDNAFITIYPENSIDRGYLVHMLRYMNLGQNSNATAQPVVSGKKIYPILFPLPPLAEQRRIVAKIEELLPLCERLRK